jgi:hypothetical protein
VPDTAYVKYGCVQVLTRSRLDGDCAPQYSNATEASLHCRRPVDETGMALDVKRAFSPPSEVKCA